MLPLCVGWKGRGIPKGAVERLDGLGVQVLDRLLVAAAHAVAGPGVAVEGVDRLGDAHLRGGHGWLRGVVSGVEGNPVMTGERKNTYPVRSPSSPSTPPAASTPRPPAF